MEKKISLEESLDKSHINTLLPCVGDSEDTEDTEESHKCRVSIHLEPGEAGPVSGRSTNGPVANTQVV